MALKLGIVSEIIKSPVPKLTGVPVELPGKVEGFGLLLVTEIEKSSGSGKLGEFSA